MSMPGPALIPRRRVRARQSSSGSSSGSHRSQWSDAFQGMHRSMNSVLNSVTPQGLIVSSEEGTPKYATQQERALLAKYTHLFAVPPGRPTELEFQEYLSDGSDGEPPEFDDYVNYIMNVGTRRVMPIYRDNNSPHENHFNEGAPALRHKLLALHNRISPQFFGDWGFQILEDKEALARIKRHFPTEYKKLQAPLRNWNRVQKDLDEWERMTTEVPATKAHAKARANLIEKAKKARADYQERLDTHLKFWGGPEGEGDGEVVKHLARRWQQVAGGLPGSETTGLQHFRTKTREERDAKKRKDEKVRAETAEARKKQNQEGRLKARLAAEKKRQKDMVARWKAQDDATSKARAVKRKRK